jgi:hypothetical protein
VDLSTQKSPRGAGFFAKIRQLPLCGWTWHVSCTMIPTIVTLGTKAHEMHIRDKPKTYTERTLILLTPEQKADLYKRARNEGVHVSDYIRSVLFPSTESRGLAERLSDLERRVATLEQTMQTPTH